MGLPDDDAVQAGFWILGLVCPALRSQAASVHAPLALVICVHSVQCAQETRMSLRSTVSGAALQCTFIIWGMVGQGCYKEGTMKLGLGTLTEDGNTENKKRRDKTDGWKSHEETYYIVHTCNLNTMIVNRVMKLPTQTID